MKRPKNQSFASKKKNNPKSSTKNNPKSSSKNTSEGIRLNKYLSNSGVCSRREADIYIEAGSVTVNGKSVTSMGYKVQPGEEVRFDGKLLNPVKMEYILLNKPKDFDTVERDTSGRRSALKLIANASNTPLSPIERLNKTSSGLIIYTNDGEMIKKISSPKSGFTKLYHLTLDRNFSQEDMDALKEGIALDGKLVKVQDVSYIEKAPRNEVGIEIRSTRKNLVRRIFEKMEYEITHLDRVVYADLTKKDLPRGHWRPLTKQEIINLKMIK